MTTLTQADVAFGIADADELYGISNWSNGYFGIQPDGDLAVRIPGASPVSIREIVADLVAQGRTLPAILRFPQIIETRIDRLNEAFGAAIAEAGFDGHYQGVYPIKVNQRRMVVETVAEHGSHWRTGLEAGSKAELALILVQDTHEDALICCNGFKDDDFIRLALWGRRLGKNVIVTLEKFSELERVLRVAQETGVEPAIGVRFKLHTKGTGQWESSGGDDAKFGLTSSELIAAARRLDSEGLGHTLKMLHCHVGSQITDIRRIRVAVREAAQAYVELVEMGVAIQYLNVGGGLAVDYDGSKTTFYVSGNYGLREYADTVVYTVMEVCDEVGVAHPTLVSESGRAITAHHAVVVIPVIDAIGKARGQPPLPDLPDDGEPHALVRDMRELVDGVTVKTYREVYNEATSNKETMHSLFDLGYLSLLERATIENLYNQILLRIAKVVEQLEYVPEEFEALPRKLADKYVCNFSLFQSLPDHWAIQALFPIVPLARLDERPTRNATLVDISCDSDGKVEKFIDLRDVKNTLPLHELREGEPYWLGIFLSGAYQDVLANAHNLFGRVNEAHVRVDGEGWRLERFVKGAKARRLIENMGYETPELLGWLREETAERMAAGEMTEAEAAEMADLYDYELVGYTYLEEM